MIKHLKRMYWIKQYNREISSLHLFSSVLLLVLVMGTVFILIPFANSEAATSATPKLLGRITYTCTDTDGGVRSNKKGLAMSQSSRGNIVSSEDSCLDARTLLESYCSSSKSTKPRTAKITCSKNKICQDGACVVRPKATKDIFSCTDSDGGADTSETGSVIIKNVTASSTITYFTDSCISDSIVREGSCSSANARSLTTELFTCEDNETCQNGACVTQFVEDVSSTDSDWANLNLPDTSTSSPVYSCDDTDGGQNPISFGSVVVKDLSRNLVVGSISDSCYSTTIINEAYCASPDANVYSSHLIACGTNQMCLNGACIPYSPTTTTLPAPIPTTTLGYSCTDSDGGLMTTITGTTAIKNLATNSTIASFSDSCYSASMVNEGYCSASNASTFSTSLLACSSNQTCVNGRCADAPQGKLQLTLVTGPNSSPTADQFLPVGTTNIPVFALKLEASGEPISLTGIKLTAEGGSLHLADLRNVTLYQDNLTEPFAWPIQLQPVAGNATAFSINWSFPTNLLSAPIQPGSPTYIYAKADIAPAGTAIVGDNFRFKIAVTTDITAKGAVTGNYAIVSGAPVAMGNTYIVAPTTPSSTPSSTPSLNISINGDYPTPGSSQTQALVTGSIIGRFKISNTSNTRVTITDMNIADNGTHLGSPNYRLFYSDQGLTNYLAYTAVSSSISTNFGALGSGAFTIDGGGFRYVTVVLNSLGGAQSGDNWQLSVARLGDVRYSVKEADLGYDANGNGSLLNTITGLSVNGTPSVGMLIKQ